MVMGGLSEGMRMVRRAQRKVGEKGGSLGIYNCSQPCGDAPCSSGV